MNTIPTRVSTSRGRTSIQTCRCGGLADETLIHILQICPITQGMRCQRHKNVRRKVGDKLQSKGFQVFLEQAIPSLRLQTDISRPDLIAMIRSHAFVLGITCVFETGKCGLSEAYLCKITGYESMMETIEDNYKAQNVEFHGLCVRS